MKTIKMIILGFLVITFLFVITNTASAWIDYNAGTDTITVSDGTYDFDDIQTANNAGGWGQMTTTGNTHYINAYIDVGNATDTTVLADTNKMIHYTKNHWWVRLEGTFQLGSKDANGHTYDGCMLYAPDITGTYMFGYNLPSSQVESGDLKLYNSNIYVPAFWAFYRGSDQLVEVIDCNVKGWGRIQGANSIIKNVYNSDGSSSYGGWTIKAPFGNISGYTVTRSAGYAFYYYELYSQTTEIRDSTFVDNIGGIYWKMTCSADAYELTLVDCISDNWLITWSGSGRLNRKYSFNIHVVDESGSDVNGATVSLVNKTGVSIISTTTNATGRLSSAYDVLYAYYTNTGGNTPYLQGPFWLNITSGAKTSNNKIEIDHKIDDDYFIVSVGGGGSSSYDDIMDALNEIKGSGFVNASDSLHNISNKIDTIYPSLTVKASIGAFYSLDTDMAIFIIAQDENNNLTSATINVSIYYPNGTLANTGDATLRTEGRYNYTFGIPSDAPLGTYQVNINASNSNGTAHDTTSFLTSANLPFIIEDDGTIIIKKSGFGLMALFTIPSIIYYIYKRRKKKI